VTLAVMDGDQESPNGATVPLRQSAAYYIALYELGSPLIKHIYLFATFSFFNSSKQDANQTQST